MSSRRPPGRRRPQIRIAQPKKKKEAPKQDGTSRREDRLFLLRFVDEIQELVTAVGMKLPLKWIVLGLLIVVVVGGGVSWHYASATWWGLIGGHTLIVLLVIRFITKPPTARSLVVHVLLILLGFVGSGFFLANTGLNWLQITCWYVGPAGLTAVIWIYGPGLLDALTILWAVLPKAGTALKGRLRRN